MKDTDFVGELINYVILQDVGKNITDGTNSKFSLQMNIKGNSVFWGKAEDPIANNLFKNYAERKSPLPNMLTGVS